MSIQQAIESWLLSNLANKGYLHFSDIHVDEIDSKFASPSAWIDATRCVISQALNVKRKCQLADFTFAIGMTLRSQATLIGINFQDAKGLEEEFTITPPSLYVFPAGCEPWFEPKVNAIEINTDLLFIDQCVRYFYIEYTEQFEVNYRRSFWVSG